MENWGLITFSSGSFYLSPSAKFAQYQRCIVIICHELAHMWFGNLVTMRWWNELWLNEGFATYAGWLAVRHVCPEWDFAAELYIGELQRAFEEDMHTNSHPVVVDESVTDVKVRKQKNAHASVERFSSSHFFSSSPHSF